ncbi:MAG: hypothetical protein WD766_15390, partial [Gemmatimonadota bacterium]
MRISLRESEFECANCGRMYPGSKLDRRLWCPDCRRVVVKRSSLVARVIALVSALALAAWIFSMVGPAPTFLMVYLVMVVAAYNFIYNLTQPVAFEVIPSRGDT